MKNKYLSLYLLVVLSSVSYAHVIKVPDDQPGIQKAINESSDGDTILVSPGRYYENVNFNNKKVVLTSYYFFNHDTSFIRTTIIDGSKPSRPDTASCILILHGQDSTTVLQGFTITGGKGTVWKDEHSPGTYREGGGVLVALSSPVIRNNLILQNEAVNKVGLTGAGGGGIRCGDGSPMIINNVIINNHGRYGGGIVLNWCNAIIRNNIVVRNEGGEDYGGGGIWINNARKDKENVLENNTIVNNHSATDGGGILIYNGATKALLRNNIIFGNTAATAPQISLRNNASITAIYCDIEGEWKGTGNISSNPKLQETLFYLDKTSPCIDAGDPNAVYNDPIAPGKPGKALFPSMGSVRNDIGVYGGPGAGVIP